MPRYSGVLFSLLFLGTCVAVNGFRYPSVWSMLDPSTGPASMRPGTAEGPDRPVEEVASPSIGKAQSSLHPRKTSSEPANLQALRPSQRYFRSTKQENLPLPDDLRPLEPPKVRSFQEISENPPKISDNPSFEPSSLPDTSSLGEPFSPVDEFDASSRKTNEPPLDKTLPIVPAPKPSTENGKEALPEMPVNSEPVVDYQVGAWDVAQPAEKIASESLASNNHSPPPFAFPGNDTTSNHSGVYDVIDETPDPGLHPGRWEPPPKVPDDPVIRTTGQGNGRQAVSSTVVSKTPQVADMPKDAAHKPVNVSRVRTNYRQKDYADALRNQPLPFELPPAASQGWVN